MSLVELDRYDLNLAEIVRGRLEAAGVPAFCFDEGASTVFGEGLLVRVMVEDADLEKARAVLAEPADLSGGDSDKA